MSTRDISLFVHLFVLSESGKSTFIILKVLKFLRSNDIYDISMQICSRAKTVTKG